MVKQSTERTDPLAAAGLQPKQATRAEQGAALQSRQSSLSSQEAKSQTIQETPGRLEISSQERKSEEERATEKVTAYFTPPQYDHIDELRRQYRKRTKQRISVNALLRRLVEHATIEDILGD